MVYYHPRYDVLAVNIEAYNSFELVPVLLEYNEEGHGVFVLNPEWIVVGAL